MCNVHEASEVDGDSESWFRSKCSDQYNNIVSYIHVCGYNVHLITDRDVNNSDMIELRYYTKSDLMLVSKTEF